MKTKIPHGRFINYKHSSDGILILFIRTADDQMKSFRFYLNTKKDQQALTAYLNNELRHRRPINKGFSKKMSSIDIIDALIYVDSMKGD